MNEVSTTTIDTVNQLQDTLHAFQDRLSDAQAVIATSVDQGAAVGSYPVAQQSFFEVTNPGLWLLCFIFLGLILLLMALRKEGNAQQPVVRVRNAVAEADAVQTIEQRFIAVPSKTALVKPLKLVKIKVRKIKK